MWYSLGAHREELAMNARPKSPLELANKMVLNSKPSEMLKVKGKESTTLDDYIVNDIDASKAGQNRRA
jgi:hypothetical protein